MFFDKRFYQEMNLQDFCGFDKGQGNIVPRVNIACAKCNNPNMDIQHK